MTRTHRLLVFVAIGLCFARMPVPARSEGGSIAPRPILFFGLEGEHLVVNAVGVEGQFLGTVARGQLAGWARHEARFAFLSEDETTGTDRLSVSRLGERPRVVYQTSPRERAFLSGWQSIWSPDGSQIALLLGDNEWKKFSLAIIDVNDRRVVRKVDLPRSVHTRHGLGMNWPPYALKWSHDGRRIVLAWEQMVALDVSRGVVKTLLPRPAMAEWAPASDAVYYFETSRSIGPLRVRMLGSSGAVVALSDSQLAGWGIVGSAPMHAPLLKLSPEGSRLAISGCDANGVSSVLVFDLDPTQPEALRKPPQRLRADGVIIALEWGENEDALAVLRSSEKGLVIRVANLKAGTWKTVGEAGKLEGAQTDLVGLINTVSWVP